MGKWQKFSASKAGGREEKIILKLNPPAKKIEFRFGGIPVFEKFGGKNVAANLKKDRKWWCINYLIEYLFSNNFTTTVNKYNIKMGYKTIQILLKMLKWQYLNKK